MNSLKIPDSGLLLESSRGKQSALPPQAFAITLSDNVIEDMISCLQKGDEIQLALGSSPALLYGSNSHCLTHPPDSHPYDLYLTKPFESTRSAERLPNTGSLFKKPKNVDQAVKPLPDKASKRDQNTDPPKSNKSNSSSGLESDIETLQNGLAAHDAAREKARVLDKLPGTKKGLGKSKSKLLSAYSSATRSIPPSPALKGAASPSMTPTLSASQQAMNQAREQRVSLVHELAVQDRSVDYLRDKWLGKDEDFKHTLEKVAAYNEAPREWSLNKAHWKELDVWKYDYDTQEQRQKAIDNAIRQYDKQRLSPSEPEWQKLLPKDERGRGKCLSRLQAKITMGAAAPAPKIKVQKADDTVVAKDEGNGLDTKTKLAGESMSRSSSNSLPPKAKKPSSQDAQVKRLTTNSKAKAPAPKTSPSKGKAAGSKSNGARILSKEFVDNSDSSGDEIAVANTRPQPATKMRDTINVKSRGAVSEPVKRPAPKRPREDDDSSSSSGATPLIKRHKPRPSVTNGQPLKRPPSDASQNSRGTATNSSFKSKNTSPAKSSPLASSPPTNASDLENDVPKVTKKRKVDGESKMPVPKRAAVSSEVVNKANKFKTYYVRYEALHNEISSTENPPDNKLKDLLDMRDRLEKWKDEIYSEFPPQTA